MNQVTMKPLLTLFRRLSMACLMRAVLLALSSSLGWELPLGSEVSIKSHGPGIAGHSSAQLYHQAPPVASEFAAWQESMVQSRPSLLFGDAINRCGLMRNLASLMTGRKDTRRSSRTEHFSSLYMCMLGNLPDKNGLRSR